MAGAIDMVVRSAPVEYTGHRSQGERTYMASLGGIRRSRPGLLLAFALAFFTFAALMVVPAQGAFPGANGWIAFVDDEEGALQDIWVMPGDGSAAPVNLTNPGPVGADPAADPVFSPNGSRIAFTRAVDAVSSIWVGTFTAAPTPALTNVFQITNPTKNPTFDDQEPTWSPNGSQVAFQRAIAYDIADGAATADSVATTLTDTNATFIADGVTVGMTVTNTDDGSTGIVTAVVGETELTLDGLVDGTSNAWTTGDAYTVGHVNFRIFRASVPGPAAAIQVTSAGSGDVWDETVPAWSPAGATIAFESDELGDPDIYTVPATGGTPTLLTGAAEFDAPAQRPSWSPDGTKIAFHAAEPNTPGDHRNVWYIPAGGGAGVQLTGSNTGTDDDLYPTFSPDGTLVAFYRSGGGGDTIWTVSASSSGGSGAVQQVRSESPSHLEPDWQPQLVGVADAAAADEGGTTVVAAPGVLANDILLTSAIGAATAQKVTDPSHGSVTVNANGSFTYTHDGSETTSDSFTYRPVQNGVQGKVATVTITVTPTNDAPVAVDDGPYDVEFASEFTLGAPGVLANDTDAEGDALEAVEVAGPTNGTVTLNADGSFTYQHDGSDTRTDSFTYRAKDPSGALSNIATVSLSIGTEFPIQSIGLVDPSQGKWYLYDDSGNQVKSFFFGNPGDYPFMGDWNGDGVETPGLYRQSDGFVYLRNSNDAGPADIQFFFGNPGDVPIAGDFNGNGFDTVSIYRPSNQTFYIINELGQNNGGLGAAEFSYVFGNPGDKPFVGDFDGDGVETVGLHRESTGLVYFRNSHTQGNANAQFIFGDPDDRLVAGDWTGDGVYSPALFRPSNTTMYFRFTNTQGNADNQYVPAGSQSGWLPVSGVID